MTEGNGEVRELPEGWCWVQHKDIAQINPKLPLNALADDLIVSFLPMAAVEEKSGRYRLSEIREYGKVKKGYTPFINGDVIFAKITPCMENSKVAVVENLQNGIGCGSTEFHVSRLTSLTSRKYLFYYLVQERFRRDARQHMTGSAGQLRVSKSYFEEFQVPLAPLFEQERIVEKVEELFSDVDQGVESLKTAQKQLKVYRQAVLKWAFEGKLTEAWRQQQTDVSPVILNAAQRSEESQTNANDRDSSLRVHSAQNDIQRLTGKALLAQIKAERENRYQQQLAEWEEKIREWEAIGKVGKKPIKPSKFKDITPLTEAELTDLPNLPKSWCWLRFGELVLSIRGGTTAVPIDSLTDYPILRSSSVRAGKIDYSDVRFLPLEQVSDTKDFVAVDDLLFTRLNGTVDYVGNCSRVTEYHRENLIYPDRLYCAKLLLPDMAKYVEKVFEYPILRRIFEKKQSQQQDIKEYQFLMF